MDIRPAHPRFWERLTFLLERFARTHEIGERTMFSGINGNIFPPIAARPLTRDEIEEVELIGLSSAVRHLSWGETTSRWSHDRYLERLLSAKPGLRAKALAEHGFTQADYERWCELYAEPVAVH